MIILDKIQKWWNKIKEGSVSFGPGIQKLLSGFVFFILIVLILTIDIGMGPNGGEISNKEFTAPQTIVVVDRDQEELKEIYIEDPEKSEEIKSNITNVFSYIEELRNREDVDIAFLAEEANSELNGEMNIDNLKTLLRMDDSRFDELENIALEIMDIQLEEGILPGNEENVEEMIREVINERTGEEEVTTVLMDILTYTVQPNLVLDDETTLEHQEELTESIRTIRRGEVVAEEDMEILASLGLIDEGFKSNIGIIIIVLILISLISFYFYKFENDLWMDNKKLLLLQLLVLIVMILAKIISIFPSVYLMYLVPAAIVSIITAVLIDSRTAVVTTVFLSFLIAMVFGSYFEMVLICLVGGMVGIYSVQDVSQRSDFLWAGIYISIVLLFLVLGLGLFNQGGNLPGIAYPAGMVVLNGILVAIFTNGLLPGMETIFGFTSSVKLLELSNPSQPLLKRMLVEAPGTYHHSVIVGNLAETAADNIGADSLLTRVGAYYHDIGKLKRPYFFTDNLFGGENPHDKISANLSSIIIKSHVKDGVEMAEKYKLPPAVKDIIREHHGTNLISYFYQQAVEDSKHDTVEENDYRYDGPRPHSREAAIIMLADVVEAAIRSKRFDKSNHNRIEGIVRGLIREKLIHNQLDHSTLTLKDLNVIADSFVKVLTGIYHQRIEYPDNLMKEAKRADNSD